MLIISRNLYLVLFLTFLTTPSLFTQTIFERIQREGYSEATLELNLDSMFANRRNDDEIPATLRFAGKDSIVEAWPLKVNVRGRFRRMNCDFPPLKLNFDKDDLRAAGLETHDDLKLVTHCLDRPQGDEYVLREYLAYKMYRVLTGISFRAQLVKITYIDTEDEAPFTRLGIILEDEKELAARLDGTLCEDCYNTPYQAFDKFSLAVLDLFQYMIGNIDYKPKLLRNLKLLKPEDGSKYHLIPYDFDFSGLVDPPYAIPPDELDIRSVRDRIYLGFEHPPEDFARAFEFLQSKKQELLASVEECPMLDQSSKRKTDRYIQSFYKEMKHMAPDFEAWSNN